MVPTTWKLQIGLSSSAENDVCVALRWFLTRYSHLRTTLLFCLGLRKSCCDLLRRLTTESSLLISCVDMSGGILQSFLGALQASLAVLLTISCGVIASRMNILKSSSSRDISKICVRLFLPALLIANVGKELHADTAIRYIPVLSTFSLCSFTRI